MAEVLPDVMAAIASHRASTSYRCRGCGAEVGHPMGACEACSLRYEEQQIRDMMANARGSIPARFRWASLARPDEIANMTGDGNRIGRRSVQAVKGLPKPLPAGIVLRGPSGAGKTTLACALLSWVHDYVGPGRSHEAVERARRAFFVDAAELETFVEARKFGRRTDDSIDLLDRAMRASVLVLDNVEPAATSSAVGRVLFYRHNQSDSRAASTPRMVTIITTWMSRAECAKAYGEGVARRAYECVLDLKPEPVNGR